jgi:D-alanine--poly(phosphoribitol) ligase subunit 1
VDSPESTLLAAVQATSRRTPHAAAVVSPNSVASYSDLWHQVSEWARRLGQFDLPAQSVIGLVTSRLDAIPSAWLGTRAAGLVPLLLDARLTPQERLGLVARARPSALADLERGEVSVCEHVAPRVLDPLAGYVMFSSGSQGARKGIVGNALGLMHFVEWEIFTLNLRARAHRVAMLTSPTFDVLLREFLPALCSGGEVHVPEAVVSARPERVVRWLGQHEIDVLHAVPGLALRWARQAGASNLKDLGWTLFAGEPLYDIHIDAWRAVAPSTRILNLYGPSETTLAKFWHPVGVPPAPGVQPVGRPLPGTTVRRLQLPDHGRSTAVEGSAAAADASFRVELATPFGSLGYLDDTVSGGGGGELRRANGVTTFVTEDLGWYNRQGELVIGGRLDALVKRRGRFVDCSRIERVARRLSAIHDASCLQDSTDGTGDIVLVMGGSSEVPAGLRRDLARQLGPDLPDRVLALAELPRLPNGKTDRQRLLRWLSNGAPVGAL